VDKLIREVVEQINSNVRFYLAKYVKLWADILEHVLSEEDKQLYAQTLMVPEMLELGAYKAPVMAFIRAGVPRSAAIHAGLKLEKHNPGFEGDVIDWLKQNKNALDPIYRKLLDRVGFG